MNLPKPVASRGRYLARIAKSGVPGVWALAGAVTVLVGGSAAILVAWGVSHLPWGVVLLLAIALAVAGEGGYRLARAAEDAQAVLAAKLQQAVSERDEAKKELEAERTEHAEIAARRHGLALGESLSVGESLYSPDGHVTFTLLEDGNGIVRMDGIGVLCDIHTVGIGAAKNLTLDADGKLMIYDLDDNPLCRLATGGNHLDVQDDGHVCLYPRPLPVKGRAVWCTDRFVQGGQILWSNPRQPPPIWVTQTD